MFVDVAAMHVVQVTIMQVVNVIAMSHGGVAAPGTVFVVMILMMWKLAFRHRFRLRFLRRKDRNAH